MSTPNPLSYGYGYRQNQQPTQQQAPTGGQGMPPSIEALKQAMLAQQYGDQAYRTRSSIRMPTENKHLISTVYDLWRSNRAEDKQQEAVIKAAEAQERQAQEASQQEMAQRAAQAKALANIVLKKTGDMELADQAYELVLSGAEVPPDLLKSAPAAKPSATQAEFDALSQIYGADKAKTMLQTKYAGDKPPAPTGKEAEYQFLAQTFGPEKAKEMIGSSYDTGGDGEGANVTKIGAENRVKLGLIKNAADLASRAIPVMFEGGEFRNTQAMLPKTEVSVALADLRESLQSMLRAISGAAIPEAEIEREVNMMLPGPTDTDRQAREKINRAIGKITNLHTSLAAGFDLPDDMKIPELTGFNGSPQTDDTAALRKKYGLD